jgi:hypothetical protein
MRLSLVAFALALAACQGLPSPAPFSERLIATIPEGVDAEVPIAFSRDGLQAVYVARSPEGCRAVRGTWKSMRLDTLC